ncbi:unnamed protein product [Prorocentrum cordatum]|uniref:Uncharacterized protein n=1 Tax=Prorocentrum cordatum TaxID=2364126 RepID=A0ABN9T1D8_9DINO|nr:unnamed protein product [Polarella glacialis]
MARLSRVTTFSTSAVDLSQAHCTWRRALAIGLAFSFLGDTGLLEWALESPIVAANASDPLSRYERISPRLTFTVYVGLSMSSVHRWSRMCRNVGEVVLTLMWLYPKMKRQPNTTYAHFPALSADEKTAAIEAGTEKQFSMEFGAARWRSWVSLLGWARSAAVAMWATSSWGTSGGQIFFAWRAALYFRAWDWAKWMVEKLDDTHTFLMELDDFRAYLYDLYQDGRLELPMLLLSFQMAFTPVLWSSCCRRGLPRFGGASPTGSDVGSDGEAGHSVHESDSESEGSKEVSEMRKMMQDLMEEMHRDRRGRRRAEAETEGNSARGGGDSPCRSDGSSAWSPGSSAGSWERIPSPADEGMHVDRMMDHLDQVEKTILADRATGARHAVADQTSTAATAGSIAAPTINLDEVSVEEVGVNIGLLRESLKDPRVRLMENLTKLKSAPTFELPPRLTARVAPDLLVQTYGKHGSMGKFAADWVKQKELYNNHIGHGMFLHCMALDRMLEASPDFITTVGCEILCSRVCAMKRAFRDVRAMSDWKQPRGTSANMRMSKVRWGLASEPDWRSVMDGGVSSERREDLTARLQQKAPFQKHLLKAGSEVANGVESAPPGTIKKVRSLTEGPIRVLHSLSRGAVGSVAGLGPAAPWERSTSLQKRTALELLDSRASWQGHIYDVDVDLGAAVERVLAGRASPCEGEGVAESLGVDSKGRRVLPKGAMCSVDVDELALPAPGTVPVKLVDICLLAVESFSDVEGRVPRRADSVMVRELESQVVHRDPALKPRGARLRLAGRLWRGGVLTFTMEKKESVPLLGVIKKYAESEVDGDLVLQRHVRAIWGERPANLRWERPSYVPLGNPASFTSLDLSNMEVEGRVYCAVGDMPDMFYRLETPPQCWPYFCLGEVGVDELVLCVAERAVDVEAPADSGYLALKVLVMGWSWAPFLARSALQACMETALGEGSVRARMVHGSPALQIHGDAGVCEALDWACMDGCGVMASSASAEGREKGLVSSMAAKVKSCLESVGLAVHGGGGEGEGLGSLGAVLRGRPYVIGLCLLKTCRLALVTLASVERSCWAAAILERLVGLWAWAAVFQRTGLAIFDQVYHEMRRPSSPAAAFRLSAEARAELAAAAYCAPFMVICPGPPWARRAFMADSSDVGCGVAVAQATVEESCAGSRYCELRGRTIAAEDLCANAEEGAWQGGCGGYAHDADELAQAAASVARGPNVRAFRFLHLFAGVRRPGGLEEHLRRRAEIAGILIEVWSLGAIIDPKHDLTDPVFLSVVVRLVDKGYCHGHGFRPLRARAEPWGRANVALTSWGQRRLELEAKSLMAALTVIRAVCTAGGVGPSELPPDPGGPPCPSIWGPVELKDLVRDFGGWANYLDQCRYGAPSMKPTMVGIFGAFDRGGGGAAARLCLACHREGRHRVTLEGREKPGGPTFRTAAAQTYQSEFCEALSEVIIEAFVRMGAKRLGPDVEGSLRCRPGTFDLVGRATAGREPLQPVGATPMAKRGPWAWGCCATDPNAGLLGGGFARLLTHSVADATASQWASNVLQFLNFCIQRGWQLTSESEVDRALADCVDIQCYGERKRATLGSVVLFGMLVIWVAHSRGGGIYAIAIYMIEQGHYVEAVWTLTQYDVYGREQGSVIRRGAVANLVLGSRGFGAGKGEELYGIDQVRFRKLWHQACRALGMPWAPPIHGIRHSGPSEDAARGCASLGQVRRRGRWKALSSVQRYSMTFALTQFRARMPEVVRESGVRAGRGLKADILRALRMRPRPRGSLPEALENAIKQSPAKDVAAELMEIKSSRARSSKKANQTDDDDQGSPGGLLSDETTFGEDAGWWAE